MSTLDSLQSLDQPMPIHIGLDKFGWNTRYCRAVVVVVVGHCWSTWTTVRNIATWNETNPMVSSVVAYYYRIDSIGHNGCEAPDLNHNRSDCLGCLDLYS